MVWCRVNGVSSSRWVAGRIAYQQLPRSLQEGAFGRQGAGSLAAHVMLGWHAGGDLRCQNRMRHCVEWVVASLSVLWYAMTTTVCFEALDAKVESE